VAEWDERRKRAHRRPPCPFCGSTQVVPIAYGLPPYDLFEKAKLEEIVLGGCVVSEIDPDWACLACERRW